VSSAVSTWPSVASSAYFEVLVHNRLRDRLLLTDPAIRRGGAGLSGDSLALYFTRRIKISSPLAMPTYSYPSFASLLISSVMM
jgi:hypothetical protein